ncbi:hypothetical protein D7Y13_02250 [Corallococcus praedator]|uniref:Uncharacterized protein n=1 Tax=Corallococcus praedator TaxID=2316724 RepID=A0ABX9QQD4_9BACT|nr:hypothetical protein D7X75_00945 [Corallococcus sp. CA031C]RKI16585.1 hypothetical protein D7Y13_02250 [Corallococcus praedator]
MPMGRSNGCIPTWAFGSESCATQGLSEEFPLGEGLTLEHSLGAARVQLLGRTGSFEVLTTLFQESAKPL